MKLKNIALLAAGVWITSACANDYYSKESYDFREGRREDREDRPRYNPNHRRRYSEGMGRSHRYPREYTKVHEEYGPGGKRVTKKSQRVRRPVFGGEPTVVKTTEVKQEAY